MVQPQPGLWNSSPNCFNGDLLELQQWHALPNTVFGVTWKSVRESPDFIPRINLDQLVLETDSPYLSLYSCCPTNHPWNLPAVALEVASLRNVRYQSSIGLPMRTPKFYAMPKASVSSGQGP